MTLLFGDPGKDGVIPTQKSVAIRALNQPLLLSYIYRIYLVQVLSKTAICFPLIIHNNIYFIYN